MLCHGSAGGWGRGVFQMNYKIYSLQYLTCLKWIICIIIIEISAGGELSPQYHSPKGDLSPSYIDHKSETLPVYHDPKDLSPTYQSPKSDVSPTYQMQKPDLSQSFQTPKGTSQIIYSIIAHSLVKSLAWNNDIAHDIHVGGVIHD